MTKRTKPVPQTPEQLAADWDKRHPQFAPSPRKTAAMPAKSKSEARRLAAQRGEG